MKALILILITFCNIIAAFSQSQATLTLVTRPQMNESSTLMMNHTRQLIETRLNGTCLYLLSVNTSCSSPSHTTDEISTLFGDSYGNEVYVPRLDAVDAGLFEQCSTNSFQITGPCLKTICKLYLFRNGSVGWIAESVTAYDYTYLPMTFYYNINIPDDDGYGYNYCI